MLGSGVWQKAIEHRDKNASIYVISTEDNQIKLGLWHFCKETVSAKRRKNLELLVFQNPSSLEHIRDAYITVYAIPEFIKEVTILLYINNRLERQSKFVSSMGNMYS